MGCVTPNALRCRCNGRRPQFRDHPQNVCKEIFGDGDLGHLEGDITAVAHDLRADFDELLFQRRRRSTVLIKANDTTGPTPGMVINR